MILHAHKTPTLLIYKAGQPAPEVLYLCTSCGGALRNNGEDGRWRRRRRPSSAPAAGRRSKHYFGGGVKANGKKSGTNERSTAEGWDGSETTTAELWLDHGDHTQSPLHAEGAESRGGRGSTARLRYAHSARVIQHAYQDFRHRQYLRDWAFSLVRSDVFAMLVLVGSKISDDEGGHAKMFRRRYTFCSSILIYLNLEF